MLLLAAFALLAGSCGVSTETDTASDIETASDSNTANDTVASTSDTTAGESTGDAPDADASEPDVAEAADESDSTDESAAAPEAADDTAAAPAPAGDAGALVLARSAAAASQAQQGYRIDQGMALEMSLLNGFIDMEIAPEGPIMTGEIAGDSSHLTLDFGAFMAEAMDASPLGGPTEAEQAEMTELFADATMETWQVGSTLYMDMSDLFGSIAEADDAQLPAADALAEGPVQIDLNELGLSGPQAANGLSQGMAVTDPAALLQALIALESVNEDGSAEVRGVETTVYRGTTSMTAYTEATGIELADQLGALADMGLGDPAALESLYDTVTVEIAAMVDADELVRRIEVSLDMAPMLTAMFADPALLGAATGDAPTESEMAELQAVLGEDLVFVTETWQDFYDYGETFTFDPPIDAADITDDYFEVTEVEILDA